jgi:F-type H+-transporting ATPase subunit epsilon
MSDTNSAAASGLLEVELVAADRKVWSGQASLVVVRTTEGDLGVLPEHEPMLAVLKPWPVTIRRAEGDVVASVNGGFLSVADNRVSLLAESAELAEDIDTGRAERALADAQSKQDEVAEARAISRLEAASTRTR